LQAKIQGRNGGDLSDVSETILVRTKALLAVNAEDNMAVVSHLAIYWGLLVNANKVIFWMLLEIISTPNLAGKVKDEISPFSKVVKDQGDGKGQLKMDADSLVKSCPLLKATFFETMRVYTAGASNKKVNQDLTLTEGVEDLASYGKVKPQTYHVKAGNFLIIPSVTMRKDLRVWKDPDTFDPSRFLVKNEDDPKKVRADISFGGGASMCKGRLFAEREVLFFIAGLLTVWEFGVDGGFKMPGRFYCGTGTANPKTPVRVRVSRRAC